jgi:hypothetical protein
LEASQALTETFKGGNFQTAGIPHQDRFHGAMAADQETYLAFDFVRELGKVARQLLGDDTFGRETTTVQMFETT